MGLTWKERVFTALLGAAAVSGLTTLILFLVEATNVLLPADTKFGIVFDAGSSHTSLFVYQWLANKENDTGVVSQALACQAKGPGISSYASDPAQAGESLQGCLEEALALIPKAKHQQTPMFLGATAGMRLLSQKNSSQAEDVFAAVNRVLSRSPVDFWGAELLAGQDEGALGWVTINYVLGLLVKLPLLRARPDAEPAPGRAGAEQPGPPGASPLLPQRLPGHAGPGRPVRVALRPGRSPPRPRPEPHCGGDGEPRGLCRRHPGSLQLLQLRRPRRLRLRRGLPAPRAGPFLRRRWPRPTPLSGSSARGPGSWWVDVGRPPPSRAPAPRAADSTKQGPRPGQCGRGAGGLQAGDSGSRLRGGPAVGTQEVRPHGAPGLPGPQVEASSPGQGRRLRDYCASGLYVLTLLLEGYGFSQETWGGIEFRKQAGGTDIGWTLGYMLNLTSLIPVEAPAQWRAQSYGVWVAGVVFLVLTLTAILGATAVQLWRRD
ncbi:ectonucleoside triphosphate diphosphohydrolase 8 isoform X5 [Balaenoptera musculus]|uniref:Ectonucleoside triphosphate diphosphohydrolase 8 n=1 Tax=Balaenoptera musculus TaxID=9771 RepID=A0A8B8XT31_BALMU|nr:ectonucleoside triphosphate diphosphohydrolase 8 isoform X5 [Balaenoptera musculus]